MPSSTMTTAGVPVARSSGGSGPRGRAFREMKRATAVEARKVREAAARRRRWLRSHVTAEADPITAALAPVAPTRSASVVRLRALLAPLRPEGERGEAGSYRLVRDALMSSYGLSGAEVSAIVRAYRAGDPVRLPPRLEDRRRAAA